MYFILRKNFEIGKPFSIKPSDFMMSFCSLCHDGHTAMKKQKCETNHHFSSKQASKFQLQMRTECVMVKLVEFSYLGILLVYVVNSSKSCSCNCKYTYF